MKRHFVTFYSPGTFVSETSTKPIDSWSTDAALAMVPSISERYNATPYGFSFSTRERGDNDLDSKTVSRSRMYFLGGKVESLAEVKARASGRDSILISNMECNKWDRIITNTNSWKVTLPLKDDDVVLDWTPPAKAVDDSVPVTA